MHKPSHEVREGCGGAGRLGGLLPEAGRGGGRWAGLRGAPQVSGGGEGAALPPCCASVNVENAGCVCPALRGRRRRGAEDRRRDPLDPPGGPASIAAPPSPLQAQGRNTFLLSIRQLCPPAHPGSWGHVAQEIPGIVPATTG